MPFAVGGGIRTIDDVRQLLAAGADKVVLNSQAVRRPELVEEIAGEFGSQVLITSIDYIKDKDGRYRVTTHSGTKPTDLDPLEWAIKVAELGTGEILLTSVERDGNMVGYDLETLKSVCDAVSVPVIASGGCGSYEHMFAAIDGSGASAVAAASIFHFTEQTPREAKLFLQERGLPMRLA